MKTVKMKISDFAKVITGGTPSTGKPEYWNGKIPWLNSGALNLGDIYEASKYITELGLRNSSARLMPPDTVLIALTGATTGQIGYLHIEASANQSVTGILPSTEHHPRYLYYYLSSIKPKVINDAYGGAQPHICQQYVKDIQIPLPPLSEQKRIAAILDKADEIRKKRRQAIDELDNLIHAAFAERFSESMANKSCHEYLVDIADIVSGVTKGRKFNGKPTVMLPYIRVANVQAGYLDLSEIKEIEALPGDLDQYRLVYGDVLLTEGGDFDKLGRGTMWEGQIENCIHQNHVFRVRVNKDSILPEYFDTFLQTQFAKAYFLRCAKKTSNLASINMTQLRKLPVPVPKMPQQREFADIYHKHNNMVRVFEMSLDESDKLFNSLVQRAFKGEL